MSSRLRTIQLRVGQLLCNVGDYFAVAEGAEDELEGSAPAAGLVTVLPELPGDIETAVQKVLGELGLLVILWAPSAGAVQGGGQISRDRKYQVRLWVIENVLLSRGNEGAKTAEEVVEKIDELVHGKGNGVTSARGGIGKLLVPENGIVPLTDDPDMNRWEITFETIA